MKAVRTLVLGPVVAWGLAVGGAASALPLPFAPMPPTAGIERAQFACGPYRCFRRPFWRYGDGRGFFPSPRFGPPPVRRFGYRPFGFGRFGGFRRW